MAMPTGAIHADQAAGLRHSPLLQPGGRAGASAWPQIAAWAVTGGKGGVGKTCVAVNLAVAMAKLGQRVLLVDFDLGLANADVLLGVNPQATLAEVLAGRAKIADAVTATPLGVDLLPAASGVDELTRLGDDRLRHLLLAIQRLSLRYDACVIDTAAGIGAEVITALRAARRILTVVTPDPTSLTDAYALLKIVEAADPGRDLRVCVNMAADLGEAQAVYGRLRMVCAKHLHRELPLSAWIPRAGEVIAAVRRRLPFTATTPPGPAGLAVVGLAQRLLAEPWPPGART